MGMALATLCSPSLRVEENIQVKSARASEFLSIGGVETKIKRFQSDIKIIGMPTIFGKYLKETSYMLLPQRVVKNTYAQVCPNNLSSALQNPSLIIRI
jgi:hypothetical protein